MKKILSFPIISKQTNEGSCGPNAMKHVILYKKGLNTPEWKLINMSSCSEKNGAPIDGLARIAKNFNLSYELMHNSSIFDLINSIDNKNPAILLIQAWGNGHYVVANGYDNKIKKVFYYDPFDGKTKPIRYENLDKRWHGLDMFERNHFGIFFK